MEIENLANQFSSVQSLGHVRLFATPWTAWRTRKKTAIYRTIREAPEDITQPTT